MKHQEKTVERRYLSARDAERYTGLSRSTLSRARRKGQLPAVVVGVAVRFCVDDLDDFMKARRV